MTVRIVTITSNNIRNKTAMQKKPIAYIVSMGAGLEAFIYREVEALCDHGVSIVLFATKFNKGDVFSPKPDWPYHFLSLKRLVVEAPILLLKMCLRPALLLEALRDGGLIYLVFATKFAPIMKRSGVRQIHCHFGDSKFFIGYYCKRLTGLPLSVTIHAHEFYTNPNVSIFRKALKASDRIFPIASRWCDRLSAEYAVPPEKIRLNHLFVDLDLYRPTDELKVLAVGRFTERKGFQYLMEAAKQLSDLKIQFIFVGFGEIDLCYMADEIGVRDKITVFNKMDQEQLRIFYQTADILCVPSITTKKEGAEGIPVVLMEGMACGLPVVATRCGAIEELVENMLIDEQSVDQLAVAIRELALNDELRISQGRRNREIVMEQFSKSNIEQFSEWLDEVAVPLSE